MGRKQLMKNRKVLAVVVLCTALLAALQANGREDTAGPPVKMPVGDNNGANKYLAEKQKAITIRKAAEALAKAKAGDDEALYNELLAQALRLGSSGREVSPTIRRATDVPRGAAEKLLMPAEDRVAPARRRFLQDRILTAEDIKNDPVYIRNHARLLRELRSGARNRLMELAPRIIRGDLVTDPNQFPHCVSLSSDFSTKTSCCTGTLVGPNTVLTAAHCGDCKPTQVYFGVDVSANATLDRRRLYDAKFIPHPDYNPTTKENDVALMILTRPVDHDGVQSCPIATTADIDNAHSVNLAGFGITEKNDRDRLYAVIVTMLSSSCDDAGKGKYGCNSGKEFVAGDPGKDTCNGDSGGPAYILKGDQKLLGGITSRGPSDCGGIGIYTRADVYRDWVVKAGGQVGPVGPVAPVPVKPDDPKPADGVKPGCSNTGYSAEVLDAIERWKKVRPDLVPR
jgi:V8-like Glu-specific endopeptidase